MYFEFVDFVPIVIICSYNFTRKILALRWQKMLL